MFINPIIRGRVVPKTNTLDVKQSKYILIRLHSSHKKKNLLWRHTNSLGSSEAEKSMPCTRCFTQRRVAFKTAQFKQTALKLSWWIMHVIGSLFASVKADASAVFCNTDILAGGLMLLPCSANICTSPEWLTDRKLLHRCHSLHSNYCFLRLLHTVAQNCMEKQQIPLQKPYWNTIRQRTDVINSHKPLQKKTWRRAGDLTVKNTRSAFESWNEILTQTHRDC